MNYKQPDGRWKQIGIVSFISTDGCQKNHPSGYTRLSSYSSSWIREVMESNYSGRSTSSSSVIIVSIAFVMSLSSILI